MKVAIFSYKPFEYLQIEEAEKVGISCLVINERLTKKSLIAAKGCVAVSLFSSDEANEEVLEQLHLLGVKYIALRSTGYNHVDLEKAEQLGFKVANVPAYSPNAIAEHALTMMMVLNRKIIEAHKRVTENNFLLDGLTGFDMNGKTVGIIGVGKIGAALAHILNGFGCKVLGYDLEVNNELKQKGIVHYVSTDELFKQSDIISLHVPYNKSTHHIINRNSISKMKDGVMLINTGRGGLINTQDVIAAVYSGKIGYLGLDVYENESGLFFEDKSNEEINDELFLELKKLPNTLITGHQAFLTKEALLGMAQTTAYNLSCWKNGLRSENELY
ncbi:MAG: 2-hydroxyacid dehydrogenase [Bacteroidia bacterium]